MMCLISFISHLCLCVRLSKFVQLNTSKQQLFFCTLYCHFPSAAMNTFMHHLRLQPLKTYI